MPPIADAIAAYLERELLQDAPAPIAHDASLVDLGLLDSMVVVALLAFAQKEFGIEFDEEDIALENVETIDAMAALVRRKLGASAAAAEGDVA
jgi:acyl carrier protein